MWIYNYLKISTGKKKKKNPKHSHYHMLARMRSNRNSHLLLVGTQSGYSHFRRQCGSLTKLNMLFPYNLVIVLLGIYTNGLKTCLQKNLYTDIYSSFIHTCQKVEATKISFSRWMDKQTVVHPDNRILFSAKKKWAIKPWKDRKET